MECVNRFNVIAVDMDGTLCMKGEDLMPLTRSALNQLHKQGTLFGLATGRPVDARALSNAKKWNLDFEFDFAVGMIGGVLTKSLASAVTEHDVMDDGVGHWLYDYIIHGEV